MEFSDLQARMIQNLVRYGEKYHITIDKEFALLKLYEEVGELAQAILIHQKKSRPEKHVAPEISKQKVAQELADVLGMVVVNAHLLDIDLEKALEEKWINKKPALPTTSETE